MEPGSKPNVAFFAAPLDAGLYYQKWQIWAGVARAARAGDAHLLYIAGGEAQRGPQAVLYDLVDAGTVQGIVSWNGASHPGRLMRPGPFCCATGPCRSSTSGSRFQASPAWFSISQAGCPRRSRFSLTHTLASASSF